MVIARCIELTLVLIVAAALHQINICTNAELASTGWRRDSGIGRCKGSTDMVISFHVA